MTAMPPKIKAAPMSHAELQLYQAFKERHAEKIRVMGDVVSSIARENKIAADYLTHDPRDTIMNAAVLAQVDNARDGWQDLKKMVDYHFCDREALAAKVKDRLIEEMMGLSKFVASGRELPKYKNTKMYL